jgi:hypothetical protein
MRRNFHERLTSETTLPYESTHIHASICLCLPDALLRGGDLLEKGVWKKGSVL